MQAVKDKEIQPKNNVNSNSEFWLQMHYKKQPAPYVVHYMLQQRGQKCTTLAT